MKQKDILSGQQTKRLIIKDPLQRKWYIESVLTYRREEDIYTRNFDIFKQTF